MNAPSAFENVADVYVLSPMQQGMLFHTITEPESGVFINQISVQLEGALDTNRFRTAWDELIDAHEALRAAFVWDGVDTPLQVIRRRVELEWTIENLAGLPAEDQEEAIERFLAEDRARGFDLARAPLMRMTLFDLGSGKWHWVWTHHHMICDGWSTQLLLDELDQRYAGVTTLPGSSDRFRYSDFIGWLSERDLDDADKFWTTNLAGFTEPFRLAVPGLEPTAEASGDQTSVTEIPDELSRAVAAAAKGHRVTRSAFVAAAWALVLSRWARQSDIVFGVTVSGRPLELEGADRAVGLFINTLPLRLEVDPELSVEDWVTQVQAGQLDLATRHSTPLADIQRQSGVPEGSGLFETIVVFENYPSPLAESAPDRLALRRRKHIEQSNYPLALLVLPDETLELHFVFDRSRISPGAAQSLGRQMKEVLRQFAAQPQRKLGEISVVESGERSRLLDLGAGAPLPDDDRCVDDLISVHFRETPSAPAVRFKGATMSYRELDERSARLASRLAELVPAGRELIGVYLERSPEMIAAIVGILRAGCAYVPLDPSYPDQHLRRIVQDEGLRLVVTQPSRQAELPIGVTAVSVEDGPGQDSPAGSGPDDLAYVIHTSGSTGRSKGVMVSHRNLVSSIVAREHVYPDSVGRFLLLSPFAFDSSIVGIFWTLCTGGTIVLPEPGDEHRLEVIVALMRAEGVTHLLALPAFYGALLEALEPPAIESLAVAIVAGEACPAELVNQHYRLSGEVALYNEYGPTETTVWSTVHKPKQGEDPVPIGRPIPGTHLRVVDHAGHLAPLGFAGEIWIGGNGVAQGYHGLRDTTERAFCVIDTDHGPERFYKTGDLAAFEPDGNLIFLGRADDQVKVRGHRVEASAVAATLEDLAGISQAAVVARPAVGRTGSRLIAYLAGSGIDPDLVRDQLKDRMPKHMVPDLIEVLPELPRLPNGKLDRAALPDPQARPSESSRPSSKTEKILADIWGDLLGRQNIGVDDDYFSLGGDSIVSIRMISRARQKGLRLEPKHLAGNPTIAELARVAEAYSQPAPTHTELWEDIPLTPAQSWFFELNLDVPSHWNQTRVLKMDGMIDEQALGEAVDALVLHHPMLRARFHRDQSGRWVHDIEPPRKGLMRVDSDPADRNEVTARVQGSLDIFAGRPFAAALVTGGDDEPILVLAAHHLVVDAVSWEILVEDLEAAYSGSLAGATIELAPVPASFPRWAQRLHDEDRSPEIEYWQAQRVTQPGVAASPGVEADAALVELTLDTQTTSALLTEANSAYRTRPVELLVAGLVMAVDSWFQPSPVSLMIERHGRPLDMGVDISRTVGWFTAAHPLIIPQYEDLRNLLITCKESMRSVPSEGLGYGILRYLSRHEPLRELATPAIVFNYLGQQSNAGRGRFQVIDAAESTSRSPRNRRPYAVEILASVRSQRLTFGWHYSSKETDDWLISRAADRLQASLQRIAGHCTSGEAGGFTPSDFPASDLSQEQLDALFGEMR